MQHGCSPMVYSNAPSRLDGPGKVHQRIAVGIERPYAYGRGGQFGTESKSSIDAGASQSKSQLECVICFCVANGARRLRKGFRPTWIDESHPAIVRSSEQRLPNYHKIEREMSVPY